MRPLVALEVCAPVALAGCGIAVFIWATRANTEAQAPIAGPPPAPENVQAPAIRGTSRVDKPTRFGRYALSCSRRDFGP